MNDFRAKMQAIHDAGLLAREQQAKRQLLCILTALCTGEIVLDQIVIDGETVQVLEPGQAAPVPRQMAR